MEVQIRNLTDILCNKKIRSDIFLPPFFDLLFHLYFFLALFYFYLFELYLYHYFLQSNNFYLLNNYNQKQP